MKTLLPTFLIALTSFLTFFPKTSHADDISMWNMQQILTEVEQDIAGRMTVLGDYGERVTINSGIECAHNVLKIGRASVLTYAIVKGQNDAFALTQRLFGPLVKPFGLDLDNIEDAAELMDVFSKTDEDEFYEAFFDFVIRKATAKGIDKLPELFTEDLSKIDEVAMDYVKDEAKAQAQDIYKKYFKPEKETVFDWDYEPGKSYGFWILSSIYNLFGFDEVCPTKVSGVLTTIEDAEGYEIPGMVITVSGDCNCKYPNEPVPGTHRLDAFTLTIEVPLTASSNGLAADRRTIQYYIDADCCPVHQDPEDDSYTDPDDEDISWPNNSLLIGTNSYLNFNRFGDNFSETNYRLSATVQYRIGDNHTAGGAIGFGQDIVGQKGDGFKTNLVSFSPQYTYLSGCSHPCFRGNFLTGIRTQGEIGIGSETNSSGGVKLYSDNLTRLGLSVGPTIIWDPCDEFFFQLYFPIFRWQQDRYSNDNTPDPYVQNQLGFSLNNGGPSVGIMMAF